jgi:hypothetical protein
VLRNRDRLGNNHCYFQLSTRKALAGSVNVLSKSAGRRNLGGLSAASELEKPEHYQSGRELLAGRGMSHATQVKPNNGASGTEGYRAGQDGDLDAASMRALSVECMGGIRHGE